MIESGDLIDTVWKTLYNSGCASAGNVINYVIKNLKAFYYRVLIQIFLTFNDVQITDNMLEITKV